MMTKFENKYYQLKFLCDFFPLASVACSILRNYSPMKLRELSICDFKSIFHILLRKHLGVDYLAEIIWAKYYVSAKLFDHTDSINRCFSALFLKSFVVKPDEFINNLPQNLNCYTTKEDISRISKGVNCDNDILLNIRTLEFNQQGISN